MTPIFALSMKKRLLPNLRTQKEVVSPHLVKTGRMMPSSSLWTQVKGFFIYIDIIITHKRNKSSIK